MIATKMRMVIVRKWKQLKKKKFQRKLKAKKEERRNMTKMKIKRKLQLNQRR